MLEKIFNKFRPKISEQDRKIIESINSMKTIHAVGGAVYVGLEDVEEEMRELREKTRHLVVG